MFAIPIWYMIYLVKKTTAFRNILTIANTAPKILSNMETEHRALHYNSPNEFSYGFIRVLMNVGAINPIFLKRDW